MNQHHQPSEFLREILPIREVKGFNKLLLVVLAEYSYLANVCMSQTELGRFSSLTERQVRRSLKVLIQSGYLTVVKDGNGRGHRTKYHINVTPYFG